MLQPSSNPPPEQPESGHNVATLDELLQSDSVENVVRNNADLRELLTTSEGIREYWKTLTEEWRDQQIILQSIERNLTTMGEVGHAVYYPGQIEAENDRKDELLEWFGQKRIVLRLLLQRLRNLETAAAALARRPEQRGPVPQAPEFDLYTGADDVRQLDWYQDLNRGPRWWLDRALDDMEVTMDKHDRLTYLHNDQKTDVQRLIAGANDRITDRKFRLGRAATDADAEIMDEYAIVTQAAANDVLIDIDQAMREKIQIIRDRKDAAMVALNRENNADQALMRSWNLLELYEDHHQTLESDFFARYNTIYNALVHIHNLLDDGPAPTERELNASYKLAWYLYDRESRFRDLSRFLDNTTMRSAISQYLSDYSQDNFWDLNALQNVAIEQLLPICNAEMRSLLQLISTLRIVAPHLDNDPAPAFEAPPPSYSPPPQYSLPLVATGSFWAPNRIEGSKHILHTAYQGPTVNGTYDPTFTWGYQLRAFFGSPDIWRFFIDKRTSYTKNEFFDEVNNLCQFNVPEGVLEAWLHFCTYTQEFFHLGQISGKVTVIDKGWETKLENELGGMSRRMNPAALARVGAFTEESEVPPEARNTTWRRWRIEVVEDVFRRCAQTGVGFPLTDGIREKTIGWLLEQINWHLEPRNRNEPEHQMWELEQYLDNWLSTLR